MTAIFVGRQSGLTVVSGGGGAWDATEHFSGQDVQCLASDPLRPETVYCGTFGQGLWRSDDAGTTWKPVGAGITHPQIMAVTVSAHERHQVAPVAATSIQLHPHAALRQRQYSMWPPATR